MGKQSLLLFSLTYIFATSVYGVPPKGQNSGAGLLTKGTALYNDCKTQLSAMATKKNYFKSCEEIVLGGIKGSYTKKTVNCKANGKKFKVQFVMKNITPKGADFGSHVECRMTTIFNDQTKKFNKTDILEETESVRFFHVKGSTTPTRVSESSLLYGNSVQRSELTRSCAGDPKTLYSVGKDGVYTTSRTLGNTKGGAESAKVSLKALMGFAQCKDNMPT